MKHLLLIFCFLFISMQIKAHEMPLAFFKVYKSQNKIKLDIKFDIKDLSKTLKLKARKLDIKVIEPYVKKHTLFKFDGCFSEVRIKSLEFIGDHIILKGEFEDEISSYKTISLENTCLISINNHSNIIEIEVSNRIRDFRMHKNRTKISIEL